MSLEFSNSISLSIHGFWSFENEWSVVAVLDMGMWEPNLRSSCIIFRGRITKCEQGKNLQGVDFSFSSHKSKAQLWRSECLPNTVEARAHPSSTVAHPRSSNGRDKEGSKADDAEPYQGSYPPP